MILVGMLVARLHSCFFFHIVRNNGFPHGHQSLTSLQAESHASPDNQNFYKLGPIRGRVFLGVVLTVGEIVAPVFALALIGFFWIKSGFEYPIRFVTQIAMMLGVPCLIFTALMGTEIEPSALTEVSLAAVAVYGAITIATFLLVRLLRLSSRTYLAPLTFGNTGNLGLPLALFAFGDAGLGYAVVIFAVMAVWAFTFGVWVVAGGGNPINMLKEPMVAATLLGILFLSQGWQTPTFLTNTLELIGQTAIPLMLITLGVAVAQPQRLAIGRAVGLSTLKLAICFPLAWYIGQQFALDNVAFAVLVLQACTPVAVTSYLLCEKYGGDANSVASLVVISTLISVISLPILLAATL